MFQEMVDRLTPLICKLYTNYRKALDPGLKVAKTLHYMATRDSSKCLQYGFRVAYNTICVLIAEVSSAIVDAYHEEVIVTPTTPDDWMVVTNTNSRKWQYHHCFGTIDGKHVAIRKPMNAGSYYFNYKNFHSIVLMALVDGDYKLTWVKVGANGTSSDAQISEDCGLKEAIEWHVIGFPPPDHLPDDDRDTPYFFSLPSAHLHDETLCQTEVGGARTNIQLLNEPLPKSQRECLRYPGQQICLSTECDKVSTQDSHKYRHCCHLLSQSHAHEISCGPECCIGW